MHNTKYHNLVKNHMPVKVTQETGKIGRKIIFDRPNKYPIQDYYYIRAFILEGELVDYYGYY